jgi:Holliday junction resolvase
MINAKKKGNHFENVFANFLKDNGIRAYKDSASGAGTREKADVANDLNIHFEVKAVKGINLLKVWQKAEFECEKTHNDPILAIHFNGFPEDKFLMVMNNYYFLGLLKGEKEADTSYQKPELKYALQNCREALRKSLKLLEK